ncbi:hypothetical protein ACIRON_12090 [Nocardioides sp. NPDC101246]|uniref:hypothetical protein n=1 Tax=Nocardioides sp. NPDC101246 TaxID=3364336 RepID=UPI0037FB2F9C
MIVRYWRGWNTPANADAYFTVLTEQVIPGIVARAIPGVEGPVVLRRDLGDEVEFATVMTFADEAGVAAFGGAEGAAVVPAAAREVLSRFDEYSAHYEVAAGTAAVTRPNV